MKRNPFNLLPFNRASRSSSEASAAVDASFSVRIFNSSETLIDIRTDQIDFIVEEGEYSLSTEFPISEDHVQIRTGMLIGFRDIDSNFVLYEVKKAAPNLPDNTIEVYAEHAAMCELLDEVVESKAVTSGTAGYATYKVIENTRYSLDMDLTTGTASTSFDHLSVWECLVRISNKWGCNFTFSWEYIGNTISGRYITVVPRLGADRGKRFDLWKDIDNISVIYDDSNVVTAVYGRGKGEVVGADDDGNPTYGDRLTIAEAVWTIAGGDPADKPSGQEYIEDTAATALYGRCGRPRFRVKVFESCEDLDELIQNSWDYLQANNEPAFSASLTVFDLEEIYGFEYEAVRTGDSVLAIADLAGIEISAYVSNVSRNYSNKSKTKITMGNYANSSVDQNAELLASVSRAEAAAAIGANTVLKNSSLVDGIIDVMVTLIQSSGTNFYTDPEDGSFVWENDEGTSAVKITGNGIMIASSKIAEAWDWTIAMTGGGIVADMVTSGTLQASLVRILGSNQFYWDADNIHIINPDDSEKEIRIGKYDGENYGFAFTKDGGTTWSIAIGFDGTVLSTADKAKLSEVPISSSTDPSTIWTDEEKVENIGQTWNNTNTDSLWIWNGTAWIPSDPVESDEDPSTGWTEEEKIAYAGWLWGDTNGESIIDYTEELLTDAVLPVGIQYILICYDGTRIINEAFRTVQGYTAKGDVMLCNEVVNRNSLVTVAGETVTDNWYKVTYQGTACLVNHVKARALTEDEQAAYVGGYLWTGV